MKKNTHKLKAESEGFTFSVGPEVTGHDAAYMRACELDNKKI